MNTGIPGAFQNIKDVLGPIPADISNLVLTTVNDIRQNSFAPANDLLAFGYTELGLAYNLINVSSELLNVTDDAFSHLRDYFTIMQHYQALGYISGVPNNNSVPNVTHVTSGLIQDAYDSLGNLSQELDNFSTTLNNTENQVSANSSIITGLLSTFNSTISSLLNGVNSVEKSFQNQNISQNYIDKYNQQYVSKENIVRTVLLTILMAATIVLPALWYCGCRSGNGFMLLSGFWWFAAIAWLLMILAALNILLYIPVKDVCHGRNQMIKNGMNEFVGTNYSQTFGITSPQSAIDALDNSMQMFVNNPNLILECSGQSSIITALNIDIPTILDLQGKYDNATSTVPNQVNSINISSYIDQANSVFSSMSLRVSELQGNLSLFYEYFNNYTQELNQISYELQTNSSLAWNDTMQNESQTLLTDINANTTTNIPIAYYDFSNVSSLNASLYASPEPQNTLQAQQTALLDLLTLNDTINTINETLVNSLYYTAKLGIYIIDAQGLVNQTTGMINDTWTRINDSVVIPGEILDSVMGYLNDSFNQAVQIAKLPDLGKCAFIGTFMKQAWDTGVCTQMSGGLGLVGVTLVLLCFMFLVMWPVILSSRGFFGGSPVKGDQTWIIEMDNR